MAYEHLLKQITPTVYNALKTAVELGKWPSGIELTLTQKQHCLEAILYYETANMTPEQRSGYIERPHCTGQASAAETHSIPLRSLP